MAAGPVLLLLPGSGLACMAISASCSTTGLPCAMSPHREGISPSRVLLPTSVTGGISLSPQAPVSPGQLSWAEPQTNSHCL